MKKVKVVVTGLFVVASLLLTSYRGSKSIQGTWQAQEGDGDLVTLEFTENKVIVDGQEADYKKAGFGIQNGVHYVLIEQAGDDYTIIFPDKKDDKIAMMIEPYSADESLEGAVLYAAWLRRLCQEIFSINWGMRENNLRSLFCLFN